MAKGRADYYLEGDFNAACSMCGRKRKASMMVKNWQGFWRCPEHNEPRHPQDFVRGVQDIVTVPWAQPQEDGAIWVCTYNGISAIPDLATPNCSIPNRAVWDTNFYPQAGGLPLLTDSGIPLDTDSGQPNVSEP